jgi:hypothetical protein
VTGLLSPIINVITSNPAYQYSCAISDEDWAQRDEVRWKTQCGPKCSVCVCVCVCVWGGISVSVVNPLRLSLFSVDV